MAAQKLACEHHWHSLTLGGLNPQGDYCQQAPSLPHLPILPRLPEVAEAWFNWAVS